MPADPNSSTVQGGRVLAASSMPTVAVKVSRATTFGLVISRYSRHRPGACNTPVFMVSDPALFSGATQSVTKRNKRQDQHRRAGVVSDRG